MENKTRSEIGRTFGTRQRIAIRSVSKKQDLAELAVEDASDVATEGERPDLPL